MTRQIDRLPPTVRRILRYCAVLGRSFRREMLDATLGADGLVLDAATLGTLSEFLEPDGPERLRFRNSLVRDAAYEGLAFRVRSTDPPHGRRGARAHQHHPRGRLAHARAALRAGR